MNWVWTFPAPAAAVAEAAEAEHAEEAVEAHKFESPEGRFKSSFMSSGSAILRNVSTSEEEQRVSW
eukprot:CAMPEP_0206584164 /NCGR_PEP_ID=MMETSP0325_2-20121206/35548_1 /ASSEMBLY_ACC=CAM_ASM_000347 /TAXON_ID=2866 /ORGANISM="Crypthecodinium cohnii, Strain Seligo" /LENGTH=65 /DNA_ID=CAMNT_0054091247 /DNA_START=103 /DNA_END=297 /DNA_ORIENTATION=+